jgi:hypothetical protein
MFELNQKDIRKSAKKVTQLIDSISVNTGMPLFSNILRGLL